ncbi:MAG: elongation factor G [Planctomycetota bacterium]|jgi:elongation factor G
MAAPDTRNVALVGHGGSGKTTLAEAILFAAKAISRQGTVGDHNTVSDWEDDEKERQQSIDSSLLHAEWKGKDFNIVDTPGYPDFLGQALRGLDPADLAIVVIHAFDGVGLNTRKLYRTAKDAGIPRVIVVNRCDSENVDQAELERQILTLCGPGAKSVTVPDAFGASFDRVKSIFGEAAGLKEGFVEAAVEADDELMEKYLEAGEVSDDDLHRAVPLALQTGTLIPVFHTNAANGTGVPELMDFLAEYAPAPTARHLMDKEGNKVECTVDGPLLAFCFKVMFDRQAGKIAFVRVFRGSLRHGDSVVVDRTGDSVKVGHMARYQGHQKTEADHAGTGGIVALSKVEAIEIGDTLYDASAPVQYARIRRPLPMVGFAIEPKARGDEAKIGKELGRLADSDPCLSFERSAATGELVLRGLSTLHLDVALKRLAVAGIEVDTHVPKVPYLETITAKADGHYRHKKQTGGAGQFGEVYLKVEPKERGGDDPLEFVDEVVGGAISKPFLSAIEKGIRQKMSDGVIAGFPVMDVRVRVYDGKMHDVDSKEIAFIIAGRNAFAEAVQKAKPALMEPVVDAEIVIPSKYMGDITSDLNSRRARIQGMDSEGDMQIIKAQAPLAEMQTYSTQLRSITAGEGSYSMELSHYGVVPPNVTQTIIKKAAAEAKEHE